MIRGREFISMALALGASASCAQSSPPATVPQAVPASSATMPAGEAAATHGSSGDIPDKPSESALHAALDGPEEQARLCIGPANGPYRVKIVFAYSGEVMGTQIAGSPPAGEDNCIRAALQAANVGPFRRAKFTLTTTISRP